MKEEAPREPVGILDSAPDRPAVSLYIDMPASRPKQRQIFGPSGPRRRAFLDLALVCRAFAPHARRAFFSELDIRATDALETVGEAVTKVPALGRAVTKLRVKVGVVLPSSMTHIPSRARMINVTINEMEYLEWLEISRFPSPRNFPLTVDFHQLRSLSLEAPPSYWHIRPALDRMPCLTKLHLELFHWQSSEEEALTLSSLPFPPFTITAFSLILGHRSVVIGHELLHLLGRSEQIAKMSLHYRPAPRSSGLGAEERATVPHELNEVVRLIMEKYIQRVRCLRWFFQKNPG